ncbi:MAG: FKBP-type peptidyl-prolyl cis-trans isomerase [Candidatus Eisenbacteria bacterium]
MRGRTRFVIPVLLLPGLLLSCQGEKSRSAEETTPPPAERQAPPPRQETAETPAPPSGGRTEIASMLGIELAGLVSDPSGLEYLVRQPGKGETPKAVDRIRAHYTGYLLDGKKFDSSVDRGAPFETEIGVGRVIRGWDIAFTNMKVGEKRVLFIPPSLGYGPRGAGGVIPPNADLVFDVELLEIVK